MATTITGNTIDVNTAVLNRLSTDGTIVDLQKDGTSVGSIGSSNGAERLYMVNDSTGLSFLGDFSKILPCDSAGAPRDAAIDLGSSTARFKDAYLSGGVYLGGTGAANKLDDFETGTWTPTWNGYTPYGTSGKYVKIGTQVTVYATLITNSGTDESLIQIDNLPFQVAGSQGGGMVDHNSLGLYAYVINTKFTNDSTVCKLFVSAGGAETGIKYVSGSQPTLGGFSTLIWTLVYQSI